MNLEKLAKKTIRIAENVSKVGVELGADIVDAINEKLVGKSLYLEDDGYYLEKLPEKSSVKDINFNLFILIDRSANMTPPFGPSLWYSGEKIEINLKIYAKYDEYYDISSCDEFGDYYEKYLYKFIDLKILSCSGNKYTCHKQIKSFSTPPSEVREKDGLNCVELNEGQICAEMNKYFDVIFSNIKCENVLENQKNVPIVIDESDWDVYEFERNDHTQRDRDPDMWDQGDINEYYGYDRDYDGDID